MSIQTAYEGIDHDRLAAEWDDCPERLARRKAAAYAAQYDGPAGPGASEDVIDAVIADTRAWHDRVFGKAAPVRRAA